MAENLQSRCILNNIASSIEAKIDCDINSLEVSILCDLDYILQNHISIVILTCRSESQHLSENNVARVYQFYELGLLKPF